MLDVSVDQETSAAPDLKIQPRPSRVRLLYDGHVWLLISVSASFVLQAHDELRQRGYLRTKFVRCGQLAVACVSWVNNSLIRAEFQHIMSNINSPALMKMHHCVTSLLDTKTRHHFFLRGFPPHLGAQWVALSFCHRPASFQFIPCDCWISWRASDFAWLKRRMSIYSCCLDTCTHDSEPWTTLFDDAGQLHVHSDWTAASWPQHFILQIQKWSVSTHQHNYVFWTVGKRNTSRLFARCSSPPLLAH